MSGSASGSSPKPKTCWPVVAPASLEGAGGLARGLVDHLGEDLGQGARIGNRDGDHRHQGVGPQGREQQDRPDQFVDRAHQGGQQTDGPDDQTPAGVARDARRPEKPEHHSPDERQGQGRRREHDRVAAARPRLLADQAKGPPPAGRRPRRPGPGAGRGRRTRGPERRPPAGPEPAGRSPRSGGPAAGQRQRQGQRRAARAVRIDSRGEPAGRRMRRSKLIDAVQAVEGRQAVGVEAGRWRRRRRRGRRAGRPPAGRTRAPGRDCAG